jgi:predicted GNAT family acetyltransferase
VNADVVDDRESDRLVIVAGDVEAELLYERDGDRVYLLHTEVPEAFRGQGTGGRLATAAIDLARRDGLEVVPWCPFARRWLREHPDATNDVTIDWTTPPPAMPKDLP